LPAQISEAIFVMHAVFQTSGLLQVAFGDQEGHSFLKVKGFFLTAKPSQSSFGHDFM
jgi:hypothetical protein